MSKEGKMSSGLHLIRNMANQVNTRRFKKAMLYLRTNGPGKFFRYIKKWGNVDGVPYEQWLAEHAVTKAELEEQRKHVFEYTPKFSVVVPTYNTPLNFLREMIDSVVMQSYENWELCIADGSGGNAELEAVLEEYAAKDVRIKYKILEKNLGISGNTNEALSLAEGDYIALFDHDDLLTADVLYEVTLALQDKDCDVVYTDEDKVVGETGRYIEPNFKPDWSPDMLKSGNYITHFFVAKKEIVDQIGGFRSEYDGSQDFDFIFRCCEQANGIRHIPKILYHWRIHENSVAGNPSEKMYAYEAGKNAIIDHLKRNGVNAAVECMERPGWYHCIYEIPGQPLVSVIIPVTECEKNLKLCLDSLCKYQQYHPMEIILVGTNMQEMHSRHPEVRVVPWEGKVDDTAMRNQGAALAQGEYLLFLNENVRAMEKDAVQEMLGHCMRDEVGVVGAKLVNVDDTISHAGIVFKKEGGIRYVFAGLDKEDCGYMARVDQCCDYSAVSSACLMISKSLYDKTEGFAEGLQGDRASIDLCEKVISGDKLVIYDGHAKWRVDYQRLLETGGRGITDQEMSELQKADPYATDLCRLNTVLASHENG